VTTFPVPYGDGTIEVETPDDVAVRTVRAHAPTVTREPLAVVARAVDDPIGAPPLGEAAAGARTVAIIVPDGTRPAGARTYLLPVLARLARAGIEPRQMHVVMARGIHPATPRPRVEAMLGPEIMSLLRPVQSTPETTGSNRTIGEDPDVGRVRVHQFVAEADLVVLTGGVVPHHLAGFGGGPKALVPGVADRATVLAAHRLTLDTLVRPDGSVRSAEGRLEGNPFREALLRIARAFGRTWLLGVVNGPGGEVVGAAAGEVGEAHEAAVRIWRDLHRIPEPSPHDLVVAGAPGPSGEDLIQGHKALLRATAWARPGAPIVWLVRAQHGPGHPALLRWFTAGKLPRHLAALRTEFHPYGLTAYSIRRIAKDHPVHVVSEVPRDLLRPMGLLPHASAQAAIDFALGEHDVGTCAVI
jgi:nickel-dependent lactate racemase